MELILRGSEYASFLNCRKQWFHQWIEGIEPKRPDGKLFFGTLYHKFLEHYYKEGCDYTRAFMIMEAYLKASDLFAMEQTEIDDMWVLFVGVSENYHKTYFERDKNMKVLATELEFLVRLEGDIYMTGTIDLVYETVEGTIRFADHKTVASLDMYEEKSKMDRQISRYWWALQQIADGAGLIKSPDGEWVEWSELKGKRIEGFDYNLIAKDFPKQPKVLKSGKLSTDKSQKTTHDLYINKIYELGLNPEDYDEMLRMLDQKPDLFLRRVNVLRTASELESAAWEFMYTAGDIHDVKLTIMEHPEAIEPLTYRNIGTQCQNMCNFKALCKTAIEGGNISMVRNLGYKKRGNE